MTDVFVVGGGPAGLAAAIAARRKGFTVMAADGAEPPADKACGEGMMPGTCEALRELGVKLPSGAGYQFRGIRFVQNDAQVCAEFPEGRGMGIRRTLLHEALILEAEKCGVKMLWKTPVVGIRQCEVQLNDGNVAARWIVGADGGKSRVRHFADLDASTINSQRLANRRHYRVQPWSELVEIYWARGVQAYVTPTARDEVCVVIMGERAKDAEFERVLEALPELRERLADAELGSRERGAVTAMQSLARVWRGNVALVGDASGGVDAITGEGLRLAFRQGLALADAMESGELREYGRAHRRLARRPLWMSKMMLLLGRHDAVRARTLRTLAAQPALFARLLAVHVGHAATKDVVTTGARVGWELLTGRLEVAG
jgi:flavin-dependent dehydrogenase